MARKIAQTEQAKDHTPTKPEETSEQRLVRLCKILNRSSRNIASGKHTLDVRKALKTLDKLAVVEIADIASSDAAVKALAVVAALQYHADGALAAGAEKVYAEWSAALAGAGNESPAVSGGSRNNPMSTNSAFSTVSSPTTALSPISITSPTDYGASPISSITSSPTNSVVSPTSSITSPTGSLTSPGEPSAVRATRLCKLLLQSAPLDGSHVSNEKKAVKTLNKLDAIELDAALLSTIQVKEKALWLIIKGLAEHPNTAIAEGAATLDQKWSALMAAAST
jgi:hypothetical protein